MNDAGFGNITMPQMETALHLLETGKVLHAAQRMALTPPTLTKGIHPLEETAGTPVKIRSNRGFSLSAADGRRAFRSVPAASPARRHNLQI